MMVRIPLSFVVLVSGSIPFDAVAKDSDVIILDDRKPRRQAVRGSSMTLARERKGRGRASRCMMSIGAFRHVSEEFEITSATRWTEHLSFGRKHPRARCEQAFVVASHPNPSYEWKVAREKTFPEHPFLGFFHEVRHRFFDLLEAFAYAKGFIEGLASSVADGFRKVRSSFRIEPCEVVRMRNPMEHADGFLALFVASIHPFDMPHVSFSFDT